MDGAGAAARRDRRRDADAVAAGARSSAIPTCAPRSSSRRTIARRRANARRRRDHLRSLGAARAAGSARRCSSRRRPVRRGSRPRPAPARRAPRRTSARRDGSVPGSHPVVQGVDPLTLDVDRARGLRGAGPRAGRAVGARHAARLRQRIAGHAASVVVTFGIGDSNLASAPAFPVLVGNALEWLARPVLFAPQPGDADLAHQVQRPGLTAFAGVVTRSPDRRQRRAARARRQTAFARLRAPGLYTRGRRRRAQHVCRQRRRSAALEPDADDPGRGRAGWSRSPRAPRVRRGGCTAPWPRSCWRWSSGGRGSGGSRCDGWRA